VNSIIINESSIRIYVLDNNVAHDTKPFMGYIGPYVNGHFDREPR